MRAPGAVEAGNAFAWSTQVPAGWPLWDAAFNGGAATGDRTSGWERQGGVSASARPNRPLGTGASCETVSALLVGASHAGAVVSHPSGRAPSSGRRAGTKANRCEGWSATSAGSIMNRESRPR